MGYHSAMNELCLLLQDVETAQKMKLSLIEKFKQIVRMMKGILKESGESVDEFRDSFLLGLNVFEKERHYNFFDRRMSSICRATTYDELFWVLGQYWDYLNYHLLECLVQNYGNDDTRRQMKEFVEDVSSFMESTTLQVFWKIEPCHKSVPPSGFSETIIKYEKGLSVTSTLKDVERVRVKLGENLKLFEYAILLSRVQKSSILISWFTIFHCESQSGSKLQWT